MLISLPFLRAGAQEDDPTQPVTTLGERAGKGAFPVSREFGWHGGIHLDASGNADNVEPVCAIADGQVVFARNSDAIPQYSDDPGAIAAHPLLYYAGWTSNGVVILKHTTEIGDGVNVEFYSIYQHMHEVTVSRGQKVYRKDMIDSPGAIYGQPNRIHFEVVADAANVVALTGRSSGPLTAPQGRTNSLWGDTHIVLPAGTPLYATDPSIATTGQPAWHVPVQATTTAPAIVTISEAAGLITLTTRSIRGTVLGTATPEDGYGLYQRAVQRYPGCPSAGYEMLRFGRVIGPDAPAAGDLRQGRLPHIRQIRSPVDHTTAYADLNGPGVKVYSDADFPDWLGWTFVDDDTDGNSRCDSDVLIDMLDPGAPPAAGQPAPAGGAAAQTPAQRQAQKRRERIARAYARSFDGPMRERLSYCVVKMPTDWSRDDFDKRWGWVKGADLNDLPANVLLTTCMSEEAYTKFKRHHSALAFWEDAQAQGLTLDKLHYHFHPGRFIQTFRKCMWLSEKEFKQLLPTEVLREAGQTTYYELVAPSNATGPVATNHRVPLNKALRKYRINTVERIAAFFGNALEETQWLGKLHEDNQNQWYYPWDGRGFLQLTGPDNYIKYWDFRGRATQISQATRDRLLHAYDQANHNRPHAQTYIADTVSGVTAIMLRWRPQISAENQTFGSLTLEDLLCPSDSAGFYWTRSAMARYTDQAVALERRTVGAIHPVDHHHPNAPNPVLNKVYYHSENFRDASATVNLPSAVGNPNTHFNGYIARCVAFAQALAVLGEYKFPDASGAFAFAFPENRSPRRV